MTKKVFISYRSTERATIERLVAAIEQADDFKVWYDQKIIGGQSWWDEILRALEEADIVVLALSQAYIESEASRLEMDYALRLGKAILSVHIDPALDVNQLGAQLQSRQIIGFPANDGNDKLGIALKAAQPGVPAVNVERPDAPMSPLAEIRDLIMASGEMPTATQQRIVDALRWHLRRQPGEAAQVHDLLARLNRKPEIARQVSDEIASMMSSSTPSQPAAPEPPRPSLLHRLNESWAMIVAALITAAATIAAVIIAANINQPASTPNTPPPSNDNDETSQQTVNLPPAEPGPFDLTLIYGARDSFTLLLNGESHLYELVLETPVLAETISQSFDSLAAAGFVGEDGLCLRYIREGTQPALPRGCNASQTFERLLPDADVFWFDDARNQFQDIALKQSGELVGLCPHAGGGGRCDFEE